MKVTFLACSLQGTNDTIIEAGRDLLRNLNLPFRETTEHPDALVLLSGGTEMLAIPHLRSGLILCPVGTTNALAAALEIKAYAEAQDLVVTVVFDLESSESTREVWRALSNLSTLRVGRIGAPSDWLIKSGDGQLLNDLGVTLLDFDPHDIDLNTTPDRALRERFLALQRTAGVTAETLEKALALHAGLKALLTNERLNAFTLRCFDFVAEKRVSACLSLAILNAEGIVAGCEGDLEALGTMLLAKTLTQHPCFMANLARLEHGIATFAHCTANLDLVPNASLDTHFESNVSVAIKGQIAADAFTVFRASSGKRFTVFEEASAQRDLAESMCRTQLSMKLPEMFVRTALGNHHIIIPGRWAEQLSQLTRLGWTRVN
jgi:L-fucose isomerase-like protein